MPPRDKSVACQRGSVYKGRRLSHANDHSKIIHFSRGQFNSLPPGSPLGLNSSAREELERVKKRRGGRGAPSILAPAFPRVLFPPPPPPPKKKKQQQQQQKQQQQQTNKQNEAESLWEGYQFNRQGLSLPKLPQPSNGRAIYRKPKAGYISPQMVGRYIENRRVYQPSNG